SAAPDRTARGNAMPGESPKMRHFHRAGLCRRELVQAGFLGAVGLTLESAFGPRAASAAGREPRAQRAILVWMPGGPPQMQLWDPNPGSPPDCRGTALPTPTSAPGVRIGRWLPQVARQMHHCCLLRTLTMRQEDFNHNAGQLMMLAGLDRPPPDFRLFASR